MLKPNVYLTFEQTARWLKIRRSKVDLDGKTKATLIVQDLTYTSKRGGTTANDITIEYVTGVTAGSEVVTVVGKAVSVSIEGGVSTADAIKSIIEQSLDASKLVTVAVSGTGSTGQTAIAPTNLSGATLSADFEEDLTDDIIDLMNKACGWVETYLNSPVLVKEFDEQHDGTNSNVIIPRHHPVIEIEEIRIDFNRAFGDSSILNPNHFFLRGGEDFRKLNLTSVKPEIHFIGQDIVLVDDDQNIILGSVFPGSVLGAIKIKYKAGRGVLLEDIPSDIINATLQLIEFWYFQRENRNIGISSQGVRGESFSKPVQGVPQQITDALDPFVDVSLGVHNMSQRNQFKT